DRAMARTEYLTNSVNIIKLSPEEKEKIEELIKIYDFVNTCSLFPSAYTQDIIVHWPEQTISIISQGETIASLPPIEEIPSWSKPTLKEGEIIEKPEEPPTKPPSETSSLEEKYLEEESKDINK
ncbi:MAG: hypothetical protein ACK413_03305, partial [Patescibacteria group bacterium]